MVKMPKITLMIPDDLNDELREYVTKKFPKEPYGKLSEVTQKALREYIKNNP
jgi:metal-responsive CopG/Arc/MetJ family transcriptional regulator